MAKTRVKKVVISGITSEQAEIAFSEFATADAKVQNIQSKMDMEITRIRDKYADILAEQQAIREKNFEIMQIFATEHREELFSKRKSYESAHGTFGFRTGTPKLKNVKGFTWASVTNLVKEFLPGYIRVSVSVIGILPLPESGGKDTKMTDVMNCVDKLLEKITGYKQRMAVNPCGDYR